MLCENGKNIVCKNASSSSSGALGYSMVYNDKLRCFPCMNATKVCDGENIS